MTCECEKCRDQEYRLLCERNRHQWAIDNPVLKLSLNIFFTLATLYCIYMASGIVEMLISASH